MVATVGAMARFRAPVVREMRDILRGREGGLYQMLRYHLGWEDADGAPADAVGGKLFRPALCLLCCSAVGGDYEQALSGAAAVELVHNFTLIHDDIEDSSAIRHGRRTVWDIWGIAHGINAGDSLFTVARLAMHRLMGAGYEPRTVLNGMLLLDRACQRLCEGQDLDLRFESRLSVGMAEYLDMIEGKTASLIAASASIGALLGGAPPPTVARFDRFGRLLGRAFQIRDDVLGIWGDAAETGKPGSDLLLRKKSYPVVLAMETLPEADGKRLFELYRCEQPDEPAVADLIAILDRNRIRERSEEEARRSGNEALAQLAGLPLREQERAELDALAHFVASRTA